MKRDQGPLSGHRKQYEKYAYVSMVERRENIWAFKKLPHDNLLAATPLQLFTLKPE